MGHPCMTSKEHEALNKKKDVSSLTNYACLCEQKHLYCGFHCLVHTLPVLQCQNSASPLFCSPKNAEQSSWSKAISHSSVMKLSPCCRAHFRLPLLLPQSWCIMGLFTAWADKSLNLPDTYYIWEVLTTGSLRHHPPQEANGTANINRSWIVPGKRKPWRPKGRGWLDIRVTS